MPRDAATSGGGRSRRAAGGEAREQLRIEFLVGGLEPVPAAFDFPFGASQDGGGGRAARDALERAAQSDRRAVFQQPFLGDGAVEKGCQGRPAAMHIAPDFSEAAGDVFAQGNGRMARPVVREEEIAGDIDEDSAGPPPRRREAGAGGAEGGMRVGVGVDGAVETHARGEIGVEGGGIQPAQVVGEEVAGGGSDRPAVGQVQMGEQIHGQVYPCRIFHTVENIFPLCGKIAKMFSMVWKTGGSGHELRVPAWGKRAVFGVERGRAGRVSWARVKVSIWSKGKAMAEELQHLIERIRKEGVESGEKAADSLVAEAKKKAAAIVAEAQKQAKDLAEKADKDAAAFAERGKKTLEQAARDLLISIGGSVGDVVGGIVDAKVGAALTPELVAQMLLKLAEAYAKDGGSGGIVAMLGETDAAAVKAAFAKEYQTKLAAGIQIESDKGIFKGFRVGAKGGQVFHDFTKEAIAESLASFLRPDLAQIVKKAAE